MADPIPLKRLLTRHDKYNTKCVCEVCTCGLHKCPRGQSLRPRFEGQTTSQAFFDEKQLQKRPTFERPKAVQTNYDPDVLKSSYKCQFTGTPAAKQVNEKNANIPLIQPKRAPFYGETSYKSTYLPKEIEVKNFSRPQYKPKDTKFEGTSAYKEAFQPKSTVQDFPKPDDAASVNSSNFGISRRRAPFEGQSAYKEQFHKYEVDNAPRRIPGQLRSERPNVKFEGESTYKQHFNKPDQPSAIKEECPVLRLPEIPREPSPGKKHVNYSAQKQVWE